MRTARKGGRSGRRGGERPVRLGSHGLMSSRASLNAAVVNGSRTGQGHPGDIGTATTQETRTR
jgi:hypothetical protein